jgi:hypothetical protein
MWKAAGARKVASRKRRRESVSMIVPRETHRRQPI